MAKRNSEDEDLLHEAKEAFTRAQDAEKDNRTTAIDDITFSRAGDQWPENIRKQRELENRPCLTINKLPAFIRQVVNDARESKPSIKVHPADSGADVETANVINGLIRNIEYTSNADVAYDTGIESAVSGGFGYWRVGLDYAYDDSFDMDIAIQRIANQFSVYGDPNSRAADSSDWDVAFVTDRLSEDEYERKYNEGKPIDWDDDAWAGLRNSDWAGDESVLIAEWWTREHEDEEIQLFVDQRTGQPVTLNAQAMVDDDIQPLLAMGILQFREKRMAKTCKVKQRTMSGAEILKKVDWLGRYIPIVPVYGDEFDIEGKRYFRSLIHNAVDAQRMFNYWRTTSTELVALAPRVPYIGPKGAFDSDIDRWNTANSRSHPFLEYDDKGAAPQRQPLDMGVAAGALQEALNASDDMKSIIGMYDASLGARSNETSGKAIMARQREGDVSTFHFLDNRNRAIRHTGRILIDLIPKVYTKARIVRIIGEEGDVQTRPINQPYPVKDPKTGQQQMRPQMGSNGQPMVNPDGSPMMQAVTAMHDLTSGKYDLTVTTGPNYTTRREEAAAQMTEMIRAFPQSAPVVGPALAKNLDWPGADEIGKKLEALTAGHVPPEVQKAIEQGKQKIAQLTEENQKLQADRSAEMAKVQADYQVAMAKVRAEQDLAMYKANLEQQASASKPVDPPKPPNVSINFKDMPPQAQAQALAEVGIVIDPATLAQHQAAQAAAAKPRPAGAPQN